MVDLRAVAKGEKAIAERRAEIEKMELGGLIPRRRNMETELLSKLLSRLKMFRREIVNKDMIVPMWVNDSIEDIEAAQHSAQRTAGTCAICGESLEAHHVEDGGHPYTSRR